MRIFIMMVRLMVLQTVLIVGFLTAPLQAQSREITPFIGWQAGGAVFLEDEDTSLDGAATFGVMISFDRGAGRKLDIVASHQATSAGRIEPFEAPIAADVTIDTLHIGGRYHLHPQDRFDPYVAATMGGTRVAFRDVNGVAFSFALGGGADLHVSRSVLLRLDGRFYSTLASGRAELSCSSSGQCSGFTSGSWLTQFAATTGVVFRY